MEISHIKILEYSWSGVLIPWEQGSQAQQDIFATPAFALKRIVEHISYSYID